MAETIRLEHEDDPSLWVELTKPTHDAFAECWNDMVAAERANRDPVEAHRNLLIDCRVAPSEAELLKVLEQWPGLPEAAWPQLLAMSGAVAFVGLKAAKRLHPDELAEAEESLNTRVIDLHAFAEAARARVDGKLSEEEFASDHSPNAAAFQREGLNAEAVADLAAAYRRPGSIFAMVSAHGLFILRRPSSSAYMAYLTGSRRDAFRAAERLVSACALHPKPGALGPILEELPALATILAAELRTMAGEGAAVVKKGSPSSAKPPATSSSGPSA